MLVGVRGPAVQSHLGGEKCALDPEGIAEPEAFVYPPAFTERLLRAWHGFRC